MADSEHGPGTYGASFADVYDSWYPGGDEACVVELVGSLVGNTASILELGVGTGRLALALVEAGHRVVGLDASVEMLDVLRSKDPGRTVEAALGDAADPARWPPQLRTERFDCVLAACNLLLNLESQGSQRACIQAAAAALGPGGVLLVELEEIRRAPGDSESFATSEARSEVPVVVATSFDRAGGLVSGQHIELHPDGSARVRPWRVKPVSTRQVIDWCSAAGLVHEATWSGFEEAVGAAPPGGTPRPGRSVTAHRRPVGPSTTTPGAREAPTEQDPADSSR